MDLMADHLIVIVIRWALATGLAGVELEALLLNPVEDLLLA
jgi:hypothetical protein